MNNRAASGWLAVLLGLLLAAEPAAEQLTVQSLIGLKELGFSEVEIREQVARFGVPGSMSAADIAALEQAGFSADMIDFLNKPQPAAGQPPAAAVGIGEERLQPLPPPAGPAEPEPVAPPAAAAAAEPPPVAQEPRQPPPAPLPAISQQQVLEIQRHLNALGYDAGSEDGIMGRRTAGAIHEFQRDAGIEATGAASAELLAQLKVALRHRGGELAPAGSQALVGGWQGVYQGGYGVPTEMYLDLMADGRFSSSSVSMAGYAESAGSYRVQGNTLLLTNDYGQTERYPFRLQGRQLIVRMPQTGEEVVFNRYAEGM